MGTLEWDPIAPFYDSLFQGRTFDVPFWVGLAKQFGSSILELTCGTGRLTFPIAQAGVRITGLDISASMLSVARKKRRTYTPSTQHNVDFILGNATDFSFTKKKFTAVFLPWGFIPVTQKEQEGLFRSAQRTLVPSGHIVIDIENSREPQEDWNTVRLKEYIRLPKQGTTLIRTAYNSGYSATKIGRIIYTLDIVHKSGMMKRVVTERTYRIYTVQELKKLLVSHGFRIVRVYGDYAFNPWTPDSPQAIVVAKRSAGNRWIRAGNYLSQFFR